jgi:PST family polysaccharide transporter
MRREQGDGRELGETNLRDAEDVSRIEHHVEVTGQTVVKSTRYTAVGQVVTQGTRFATNILLARLLSPEDFGVVAVAILVSTLLDQFKDMGTGSALIQRRTLNQVLLNSVFYLNIALGVVAALILTFLAEPIANLLGSPTATPVLRAYAVITVVTALGQIHQSLLRRQMMFRQIATAAAVSALGTAAVSITGALLGLTYWAMVIGAFAGALVGTVMVWVYNRWRPTRRISLSSLRSIWTFGWNLFLSNVVFIAWTQLDKVIISRFVGGAGLGVYTLGQRVVTTPLSALSTVIDEVTFPAYSRRQDDDLALRNGFKRSAATIALVTFPLMTGLALVASPLVDVVLGPKWAALVPIIWVLAPAGAAQSVSFNSGQLQLAKGKPEWTWRCGLAYLVVLAPLQLLLVPWGAVGVAVGYTLGTLVLAPIILKITFSLIDMRLRDYLKVLWPFVWMSAVMGILVGGVSFVCRSQGGSEWLELLLAVTAGLLSYTVLLHRTKTRAYGDLIGALRGTLR